MFTEEELKLTKFDAADYIKNEQDAYNYLAAALEENDPAAVIAALDVISRAVGIKKLSEKIGVAEKSLYKSFNGKTKPQFDTVFNVVKALGFKMQLVPITAKV